MKLAVFKHPSVNDLANCIPCDDKETNLPKGAVWMTEPEFNEWVANERKTWVPPITPVEIETKEVSAVQLVRSLAKTLNLTPQQIEQVEAQAKTL